MKESIAFKTTAEKGIIVGRIKSTMYPTPSGHVRREAVKFGDDLAVAA